MSTAHNSTALPSDIRIGCSLLDSDRNAAVGDVRKGRILLKTDTLGIVIEEGTGLRYAFSRKRHACFAQLVVSETVEFFANEDKTVARFAR